MTFASLEDYKDRYGEIGDEKRVQALLSDAESLLLSAFEEFEGEPYRSEVNPAFDRSAKAVCCLLANRVLGAPAQIAGATQLSQGAGVYSASVTFGAALGEMYLGRAELKRLGLCRQQIGSMHPKGHEKCC